MANVSLEGTGLTPKIRLRSAWRAVLIAVFCFSAHTGAGEQAQSNTVTSNYVLDLSSSPHRGVSVGKFRNLAFRLDVQKPIKKISVPVGDQRMSELVASFDYAGYSRGQESLLERSLRNLAAGDRAWVDNVDVSVIPSPQRGLSWTGGVCYGFREPDGRWHWDLTSTPLTYYKATDRYTARILVRRSHRCTQAGIRLLGSSAIPLHCDRHDAADETG